MEKVYFVRHAKSDISIKDDLMRPLTKEGIEDCKKVTEFLLDKEITRIFSSPYKRSIDTIKNFADKVDLKINIIDDLRERKIDTLWIEDFNKFAKEQWDNFEYKLSTGESLNEVQQRNIRALQHILEESPDKNIVISTHGTALSTIINFFNGEFRYSEFERIKNLMPFIVCITFNEGNAVRIEEFMV